MIGRVRRDLGKREMGRRDLGRGEREDEDEKRGKDVLGM